MDENGLIVWESNAYVMIDRWAFMGGKSKFLKTPCRLIPRDTLRIQYRVIWGRDANDTVSS